MKMGDGDAVCELWLRYKDFATIRDWERKLSGLQWIWLELFFDCLEITKTQQNM